MLAYGGSCDTVLPFSNGQWVIFWGWPCFFARTFCTFLEQKLWSRKAYCFCREIEIKASEIVMVCGGSNGDLSELTFLTVDISSVFSVESSVVVLILNCVWFKFFLLVVSFSTVLVQTWRLRWFPVLLLSIPLNWTFLVVVEKLKCSCFVLLNNWQK